METFLDYLIKSSICITAFYIAFRWTLKKEKTFAFNRFLLIGVLVLSVAIPLVKMPSIFSQNIEFEVFPVKNTMPLPTMEEKTMQVSSMPVSMPSASTEKGISAKQVMAIIYVSGLVISFLLLISGLAKLTMLFWKVKIYRKKNYRLALVNHPITPMNFGRFIILSKKDYSEHKSEILGHELAHIKFWHTFDLLVVELVKLFHWFNPFVYALKNDLKEIQEFQVDQHILSTGTNSKEYQLLLIRKCVGDERYALANSFNHCQIKNRIVMMNKSKKQKGKAWKVAIFLPIALLMLMAFGNKKEEVPISNPIPLINEVVQGKRIWNESDFEAITNEALSNRKENDFFNGIKWHNVLMNRKSQIMMDGKVANMEDVGQNMAQFLQADLTRYQSNNGIEKKEILSFIALLRKDIATNSEDFNVLINAVANEFINARKKLAEIKYKMSYESLNDFNKETVNSMIPLSIYIVTPPKKMKVSDGIPPPPPPPSTLKITKEGIFLGEKFTLEELKKLVDFNSANGYKMCFILKIESGVSQSKVDEVKAALQNSTIVRTEEFQLKPPPPPPPTVVTVKKEGIYMGNKKVSLDELKKEISESIAVNPNQVIAVRAGTGATDQQVIDVKEALRKSKALHINYSTEIKEKDQQD
ncbi:MAG: hypothetical protein JW798_16715 [Prolixibacteraceae bacterium]|nr:hypothetical protein [Prolixibacteraceae bacterium]